MLSIEQIKYFIDNDRMSKKKRLAKVGERYYEGDHDIKNYKLYYYNTDRQLVEDKTRSNIKIPHPFFTELIDQKIQYQFSGDGYIFKSNLQDSKLQEILDEYLNENEDFKAALEEVSTDASAKGFGYMYLFRDKEGKLAYQCAETMGVVEVRAKDNQDNCDYVIYWYIDRINEDNKKIKKYQVWSDKEVCFFTQVEEEAITMDESTKENPNPRQHSVFIEGARIGSESFGFIPFFRLDNNSKQISDLKPIKDLIDDYDVMACGLSNNIQDASEYLLVVKGFDGDDVSEIQTNAKTTKAMGVPEGGDVDFKTVAIPYDARKVKLELDEKNIYRFGMGFNSAQLGDGNITNVVIKSRYALLDLKCNKFETQLRKFLRKILKIVLDEVNKLNNTSYQLKDVYMEFDREVMTNALDNAQIEKVEAETRNIVVNYLLSLAATLDNETIVQSICECLDIDYEEIKDKLPVDETKIDEVKNDLDNVPIDDELEDNVGVS